MSQMSTIGLHFYWAAQFALWSQQYLVTLVLELCGDTQ
ncbi:hypothetical protein JCM19232_5196 [Vibrio ishigakensis]|uniref:Uncharacterized protein n=1 Tax=Vibrio ishigakensis TaxID=1481914 RepID=A0A0B8PCD4_9VIBR|nr:hypothetical protein JCM19232_5196 [Vibrio ishigakensis]